VVAELEYRHVEEAGVLFGVPGTHLATLFVRDRAGKKTANSFTLDTNTLNAVIRGAKPWNLELLAVVHSHPPGVWEPSAGDIQYARQLFAHPRNGEANCFFLPLLVNGLLIPYLLYRNDPDRVVRAQLKIIG
jgi:proteasome lid subunit RPN8/RPN11